MAETNFEALKRYAKAVDASTTDVQTYLDYAARLRADGVQLVVMESTSDYWHEGVLGAQPVGHNPQPLKSGLIKIRTLQSADEFERVHAGHSEHVRIRVPLGATGNIACVTVPKVTAMTGW